MNSLLERQRACWNATAVAYLVYLGLVLALWGPFKVAPAGSMIVIGMTLAFFAAWAVVLWLVGRLAWLNGRRGYVWIPLAAIGGPIGPIVALGLMTPPAREPGVTN